MQFLPVVFTDFHPTCQEQASSTSAILQSFPLVLKNAI